MQVVKVRLFSSVKNRDCSPPMISCLTISTSSGKGSVSSETDATNDDLRAIVIGITELPVTYLLPLISLVTSSQGFKTWTSLPIIFQSFADKAGIFALN